MNQHRRRLRSPFLIMLKVRVWPRLCKNALFSKIAELFTTLTKVVMYMPAAYGTPWQYYSNSRFNTPLLKITFCFYTASAKRRHSTISGKRPFNTVFELDPRINSQARLRYLLPRWRWFHVLVNGCEKIALLPDSMMCHTG